MMLRSDQSDIFIGVNLIVVWLGERDLWALLI